MTFSWKKCIAWVFFRTNTIQWFRSYLTNRLFSVNLGNEFPSPGKLSCGVPQGSILGPPLFLLYVNDMPKAVSCELLLYADDTCLICMRKDIKTIEHQLNKDLSSLCEWFIDNKLSIHLGKQKIKSILFDTTKRLKDSRNLDIRYKDIEIKQHSRVCTWDTSSTAICLAKLWLPRSWTRLTED